MEQRQTTIIYAKNLSKTFRDFWRRPKACAVDGIDLEIRSGEVFGLLGPNGSGKSTTIKMMLGLLYPSGGQLRVLGNSPRVVKTKARIGYLPEESHLYEYLTARETLNFYGKLFALNASERKKRIEQLLDMVGLKNTGNRVVKEFSKGMTRRLGLAQALINDPELILLDEPTSGLDPLACRQVKDLIVTLSKRGKTVLLSSHLLADVEDVCNRIAILYGGKIQAVGSIKSLLQEKQRYYLSLPSSSAEDILELLPLLKEKLGEEPQLEHPIRSLEDYFLEVIHKARETGRKQSGAELQEEVAPYLKEETTRDVLKKYVKN